MAKMGFKQGGTLGKSDEARKEPIHVSMKEDRSGIGHESEMKRKFREEAEEAVKRVKLEDEKKENYLEELKRDHLEQKLASQLENAQRVAETMDEDEAKDATDKLPAELKILQERHDSEPKEQGLSNINVLYRGLVQDRRKRELEKQNRLRDWNDGPLANFVVDEEDDDSTINQSTFVVQRILTTFKEIQNSMNSTHSLWMSASRGLCCICGKSTGTAFGACTSILTPKWMVVPGPLKRTMIEVKLPQINIQSLRARPALR